MAKTILAFAIAFFAAMTVFASAAEACISCEYVPEVAKSPSKSYGAKRYNKKRINRSAKKRKARPAKKRSVKRKTIDETVETAKTAPIKTETKNENSTITEKVETAKTAPIKTETQNENSTITKKVETAKTAPINKEPENESSSISMASIDKDETFEIETKGNDEHETTTRTPDCKRFFPGIGRTLTVPCE